MILVKFSTIATMRHTVLDWQKISKNILGKVFYYTLRLSFGADQFLYHKLITSPSEIGIVA